MRRRAFIAGLAGAAVCPFAAHAQKPEQARHIGVLMALAENDTEGQNRIAAFVHGLQQAGWDIGGNLRIDYRWTGGRANELRKSADELVKLAPDAILATDGAAVVALLQMSRRVPIVFVNVVDPVGAGFAATASRPGGNATGFTQLDDSTSGKWLGLLKEIAPGVKRAAVLRESSVSVGVSQYTSVQSAAAALGVEVSPIDVRGSADIERAIAAFARSPNGGLVVTASDLAVMHRDLIVSLAAKHKLPTVYCERTFVAHGGLISYGPDLNDQYRLAAGYTDRILKGEKPADMPVRSSAKVRLAINRKTAKALGLAVPPALLERAEEVIE
jgi:putative ABC transport system substrate-binding protein